MAVGGVVGGATVSNEGQKFTGVVFLLTGAGYLIPGVAFWAWAFVSGDACIYHRALDAVASGVVFTVVGGVMWWLRDPERQERSGGTGRSAHKGGRK